jgi:hypothetical protein
VFTVKEALAKKVNLNEAIVCGVLEVGVRWMLFLESKQTKLSLIASNANGSVAGMLLQGTLRAGTAT